MNLLIRNGIVVEKNECKKLDILISDGKIAQKAEHLDAEKDAKVIDAGGCYVMPGLIDAHTHYHLVSRGTVTADSFPQGSRAAVYGGVTTTVDFADHNRGMNLVDSAESRLREMAGRMAIDYSLHQGVYGHGFTSDIPKQLEELRNQGIKTLKIFTTYRETGYLLEDKEKLECLFENAKRLGMLVTAHCEFNPLIEEISNTWKGTFLPPDHADLRPAEAEAKAIEFYGNIAYSVGCPLYIVHVSSEKGLNEIRKLRAKGAVIYAETTPTYLFLDRSYLEGENGSLYVMTPPLRTTQDNIALINAVEKGEIDVVATDHCSFTKEQKLSSHDVRTVYPGIPGSEEMFSLMFTAFGWENPDKAMGYLVQLMSENPARLFGLYPEKGSLEVGTDADISIYNPSCVRVLKNENIHSACGYTPYDSFEVKGDFKAVVSKGKVILEDGIYSGTEGEGAFVKQHD